MAKCDSIGTENDDKKHSLTIRPLVGIKFCNPYIVSSKNISKGIFTMLPQFGADITINNTRHGFSIRKEFFYVMIPYSTKSDILFKLEDWAVEYKYVLINKGKFKNLQLGTGITFNDVHTEYQWWFGHKYPWIHSVFFVSVPYKYLRFEIRSEYILWPQRYWHFFYPLSCCLTYNFSK